MRKYYVKNNYQEDEEFLISRFNYHLEKVRDLVNTAFIQMNLFPIEPSDLSSMDVDKFNEKNESSLMDFVEPVDRLMCEIVDEIPF